MWRLRVLGTHEPTVKHGELARELTIERTLLSPPEVWHPPMSVYRLTNVMARTYVDCRHRLGPSSRFPVFCGGHFDAGVRADCGQ